MTDLAEHPPLGVRELQRLLFVWLYRLVPSLLNAAVIIQPDTIVRWHRAGFRSYWRWKSRSRGGRPKVSVEVRNLIRRMNAENPLWGAPRIHGELLKLGIEVAQSTVAKYMTKRRPGSGQTWKTFLRNHVAGIGAMDFLVVPTINFRLLFVLVILRHAILSHLSADTMPMRVKREEVSIMPVIRCASQWVRYWADEHHAFSGLHDGASEHSIRRLCGIWKAHCSSLRSTSGRSRSHCCVISTMKLWPRPAFTRYAPCDLYTNPLAGPFRLPNTVACLRALAPSMEDEWSYRAMTWQLRDTSLLDYRSSEEPLFGHSVGSSIRSPN